MSVGSSLYIGASGLSAHGDALSVVGDNIANANTIGFKGSRANFEDILARSVGGGADDIGMGARLANVQRLLTQGALLGTGNSTDLAIKGDGYFVVRGNAEGLNGQFYTRAGQFSLDKDGNLVNQAGLIAQGYVVDTAGNLIKKLTDIKIPTSQMSPVATTTANIYANLDASSTTPTTAWPALPAAADLTAASNYSTNLTVYDSLGKAHTVTAYYRKEAGAGAWSVHLCVDAGETGGTAGQWAEIGTANLTFDTSGKLTTVAGNTAAVTFTGAAAQTITLDFGDSTGAGGTGLKGSTSFASSSTVSYLNQNGFAAGSLAGVSVDPDGAIYGVFSNGQRRLVGKLELAKFQSPEAMQRIGGNLMIATAASGPALISDAAAGGMGAINSGSLEQSNVDLARQFVDMITFQRGFQSNSRTIQTADQMLQEVISIKR